MCGPFVHYIIERLELSEDFQRAFPEGPERDYAMTLLPHVTQLNKFRGNFLGFPIVFERIHAGVDIATGEPGTNDGTELTENEKNTLRWHFVSEFPTVEDLVRKHIKPHFGKRDDMSEWITTMCEEMLKPEIGALLVKAFNEAIEAKYEDSVTKNPRYWNGQMPTVFYKFYEDDTRTPEARKIDRRNGFIQSMKNFDRSLFDLDNWIKLFLDPKNRQGYWANKQELPEEPKKKTNLLYDETKNSHAELIGAK